MLPMRWIQKKIWVNISRNFNNKLRISSNRDSWHQVQLTNTLLGRFIEYVNKHNHIDTVQGKESETMNDLLPILKRSKEMNSKNIGHVNSTMQVVDKYCCSQLTKNLKAQEILQYLGLYVNIVPNRITKYNFFNLSLNILSNELDKLNISEMVAYMFYISLLKRDKRAQKLTRTCLRRFKKTDVENLNVEELLIVCSAQFRTSTKIDNQVILDKVISTLNDNLYLLSDAAAFITLTKTLRYHKYQNEDLLNTISSAIFFNKTYKYYNFAALCHILALFVDCFYHDENLLKLFMEKCIQELKEAKLVDARTHVTENIRTKDLKRFLWAYSTIGHRLPKVILEDVIEPRVKAHLEHRDYEKDPDVLVDTLFYMYLLDHKAYDLIKQFLSKDLAEKVRKTESKSKIRLNMLLVCLKVDNFELYKELNLKEDPFKFEISQSISDRVQLMRVYEALKYISHDLEVNKIAYEFQLPHLNIVGITGYRRNIYKTFFVEVLDKTNSARNKVGHAIGPMQLKLRFLRQMDPALIILTDQDIEAMQDCELHEYLKTEIGLTC